MEILNNNGVWNTILENNNLVFEYTSEYTNRVGEKEVILKNVPKSKDARQKMYEDICYRAQKNVTRCQNYEAACEDYYSLFNRYERQLTALYILINGDESGFDYGDVIA